MVPMRLAPSMESKPIREVAYETLKNAIVTGEIPAGSRIVETEYAERMHISRTPLREALRKMCECQIMEVGPGLKSGVRIRMDNPAQLGGELLCAIVGALQHCTPPCVVVNFDTATTLLAVDTTGALVGGAILPGPQCSLGALIRNTAQLPQVELEARPRKLLGTNTADCLHSGIVYGTAAMLDGMVAQIRGMLGASEAPVVATGTLPDSVRAACTTEIHYRETLILEGLYVIWKKNARK